MNKLRIKLDEDAIMPTRAYESDAGLDLYSAEDAVIFPHHFNLYDEDGYAIPAKMGEVFDTGVHVELAPGTFGRISGRSGLNINNNIICPAGTVDAAFRGSIKVKLYNLGQHPYTVHRGDRIAQLIIERCEYPELELVDELEEADRGNNGFGSTGR